jgi:cytochrome c peroxidase
MIVVLLSAVLALGVGPAFGLSDMETVGKMIYKDKDLSLYNNQSCMTCHHPGAGFADPANAKDPLNSVVSTGSDGSSVGGRNAPISAYAGFSPEFGFGFEDGELLFSGGMFWDGRATGWTLGDPLAEQAQGPFLNPVEMALPDAAAVVARVAAAPYAKKFEKVFPGTDYADVSGTYDNIAIAIAAYEKSPEVTMFNSLFDQFYQACVAMGIDPAAIDMTTDLAAVPQGILNDGQLKGLALFNDPGKGNCAACHVMTPAVDPATEQTFPPVFTDFTYDNLGIPKSTNPAMVNNPVDLGLGGAPQIVAMFDAGSITEAQKDAQNGKFKVPPLRNVAKSAPYGHNGYFATLEEIVNFYNTRDVGNWDAPEVAENVNAAELGNLGLTAQEEKLIVNFMKTLTD